MAQIEILSEEEISGGWAFGAHMLDDCGSLHQVRLTLNWSDYNLWSPDGGDEPAKVAEAVLIFLLSKQPAGDIRPRLDASLARRLHADADTGIPTFIQRAF